MIYKLDDLRVQLPENYFIADNATVIGNVSVGNDANIWFNAVIRGDWDQIVIGAGTSVQDGAVLHTDPGYPMILGSGVIVGHKAMLHGCTIGDHSLVGMDAVILNGAKIGSYCIVGANALVTQNMVIPDGSMVIGSPAKIKRQLHHEERQALEAQAQRYARNGQRFNKGLMKDEAR